MIAVLKSEYKILTGNPTLTSLNGGERAPLAAIKSMGVEYAKTYGIYLCEDTPPEVTEYQRYDKKPIEEWDYGEVPKVTYITVDIPIELLREAKQYEVRQTYTRIIQSIADEYPAYERESWPMQVEEANALVADENAVTPWIDAAATGRGITKIDLAQRILDNDGAYRSFHGFVSGIRQGHEDAIGALETREAVTSYDVSTGWPE